MSFDTSWWNGKQSQFRNLLSLLSEDEVTAESDPTASADGGRTSLAYSGNFLRRCYS